MGSWAHVAACDARDIDENAEVNAASQANNSSNKKNNKKHRGKSGKKDDRHAAAQDGNGGRRISKIESPNCDVDTHKLVDCRKFAKMKIEDKLQVIQEQGLCFRCLGNDHWANRCRASCKKCDRRHHELLHDEDRDQENEDKTPQGQSNAVSVNASRSDKIWLGIVPVVLHGEDKDVETYALVDSGANVTLIRQDIFDELGIKGEKCVLGMVTVDSFSRQVVRQKANINASSVDGQGHVELNVYTTYLLTISLNSCGRDLRQWDHLKDIQLPEIKSDDVGLLIGTDTPEMFWSLAERRGGRKEPVARKTLLGWIVLGPVDRSQ